MADSQGCGFHRCQIPLASMVEANIVDGRIDMAFWPDNVIQAAAPDVIVFQRQVEDEAIKTIERWRQLLPNTLFVFELDDYLDEIPRSSFHHGFMPPSVGEKTKRALAICDRATTTTDVLADWLRSLGAKEVFVVPNGVSAAKLHEREPRLSGRLRIGFAGGMSHGGDLKLIEPAMREIGGEVDWVFFGTRPDNEVTRIEFHEGAAPIIYLDQMAKLDADLMLAPLEDNPFNHAKSNLRLIETGTIGACVIAQDMTPYRINKPPVFGYATTPEDWTREIRRFIDAKPSERRRSADALRNWVGKHYILERMLKQRMEAWLPPGEAWRPLGMRTKAGTMIIACQEDGLSQRISFMRRYKLESNGLEAACEKAISEGSDLCWLRPATFVNEHSWNVMLNTLSLAHNIASSMPVASDGINAYPVETEWMPMGAHNVRGLEQILARQMRGRKFKVVTSIGPCVMISGNALRMLGIPDVKGCGGEEQAIMEWGLRAAMREWVHMQSADTFVSSLAPPMQPPPHAPLRLQARGTSTRLQEKSEGPTAEEREKMELALLRTQWAMPRPGSMGFDQGYDSWKAINTARRQRMKYMKDKNEYAPIIHVAEFGTTFAPFGWIIHVDETVKLDDEAIDVFSNEIMNAGPDVSVIYSDCESLFPDGNISPEFKTDFDYELFLAQDYVTSICAVRVNKPFDNRLDLYGFVLDEVIANGCGVVRHIPRTLGTVTVSVKPEESAVEALGRQILIKDKLGDYVEVTAHKKVTGCLSITRDWHMEWDEAPLVSIVIPTLGGGRLLQPCVNTIRQHTDYPNYEIIVVLNGEREEAELGNDASNDPRVKVVKWDGLFNWSKINNWAIREHAKGEVIVTMNDDTATGVKKWLDFMVGQLIVADVGVVGARMVHPAGIVQHCGVIAHNGLACHQHKGLQNGQLGHMGRAVLTHEARAVTGACMAFLRRNFELVSGFDEILPMNYNDTDFCMKLGALGYRHIVEMNADLLHSEGTSRPDMMAPESLKALATANKIFSDRYNTSDPYWNPNFMLEFVHGGLMVTGSNCDALAWRDDEPRPDQERVLLVNDEPGIKGMATRIIANDGIPMAADLSGFTLRLTAPAARNTAVWDVRDPDRMVEGLRALGVSRIILRSFTGREGGAAVVEALRCMKFLDIAVEMIPAGDSGWMMTPWDADNDLKGTPFRSVDIESWRRAHDALWPSVVYQDMETADR